MARPDPPICPHCGGTGRLVRPDPVAAARAIAECTGGLPFTVAELVQHCVAAPALADALGDLTPRRLGQLLHKASVKGVPGFRVERIGAECGAAIWQITVGSR
jgi:hypothetical protein